MTTHIDLDAASLNALRNTISRARQAYYHGGNAIMSDAEFDALEDQLRRRCPGDPLLSAVGAPVPADGILAKAVHAGWCPMGSLFKVNSEEELRKWTGTGPAAFHASVKGDGASMALYYEDGKLVRAVTRGDGFVGEDVTANAAKMAGVLAVLATPWTGAVRCEVVLTRGAWERVDPAMATNPRNVGNGILGRKDGTGSEHLTALAFDICSPDGPDPETESLKFSMLEDMGFATVPWARVADADMAVGWFREIERHRSTLPFWIDGVVVRVDNVAAQIAMGVRDNRPKGQRAWKFEAEGAETTLEAVELSVGHTGTVVPTGVVTPVQIGGTTVTRVLLNNWEDIARMGVRFGDRVMVIKANDIIPKVVSVVSSEGGKAIPEPTECPSCGAPTARAIDTHGKPGAMTECTASPDTCPAQRSGKIKRWVKSLNILGIGDALLEAMISGGVVGEVPDLYKIKMEHISEVVINPDKGIRLGMSRARAVVEQIGARRELTLPELVGSLGVRYLGKRRVALMIGADPNLGSLEAWLDGRLAKPEVAEAAGVPGMGKAMAGGMARVAPMVRRLLAAGVAVRGSGTGMGPPEPAEGGLRVCISGKLPSGRTKAFYGGPLAAAGHVLEDSVKSGTDVLVLADPNSDSSKAKKARKAGIRIVGEDELVAMVGEGVAQ